MNSELIPGYPKGSDLTILNTYYNRGRKEQNGKWSQDKLMCLFIDNKTNKKHLTQITNPNYTFYVANDDVHIDHNLLFIEEKNVTPVTVPYKDVLKTIADYTGNTDVFFENIRMGCRRLNNQLHTIPTIFNSDMDIQDHFRFQFSLNYVNDPSYTPTKAFSDIETDTNYQKGDFPELGEVPINSMSYIDQAHKMIICYALVDPNNQSSVDCEKYSMEFDIAEECKQFCINHIGEKRYNKYKLTDFKYKFIFYNNELQMLCDFYKIVNLYEPDILLYWNGADFDTRYIVERIKILGGNPAEIMSTKDAPEQIVDYYFDERNKPIPAQRGDWYFTSSHTTTIDQMIQFASRRKGQSAFDNNKLDYIARMVAKVGKLDWSKKFRTFSDFIRGDFKLFLIYNVCDTLAQYCIEFVVNDMEYMVSKCIMNNTRYEKCHRQTVYLTNRGISEFRKDGFIMGNNNNRNNEKPPKFPGALVGDPRNNNDYAKVNIYGQSVNIANNLDDYDYKSLYPSIMRQYGIAPNTQIGKVIIDNVVHYKENRFKYGKYDRGGQFFEDFTASNYIEFCNRWFHLAGIEQMFDDVKEYASKHKLDGYVDIFAEHHDLFRETRRLYVNLLHMDVSDRKKTLFYIDPGKRTFDKELQLIKNTAQMDINDVEQILARKKREADEDAELEKFFTEIIDPATVSVNINEEGDD